VHNTNSREKSSSIKTIKQKTQGQKQNVTNVLYTLVIYIKMGRKIVQAKNIRYIAKQSTLYTK